MGTHPCVEHVAPPKTLEWTAFHGPRGPGRVDQETILLLTGLASSCPSASKSIHQMIHHRLDIGINLFLFVRKNRTRGRREDLFDGTIHRSEEIKSPDVFPDGALKAANVSSAASSALMQRCVPAPLAA
jgi:hypothetical protein